MAAAKKKAKLKNVSDLGGRLHLERDELTQRSAKEADLDAALKAYLLKHLPDMGNRAWNWNMLVTMKRQVLSRIIYFYELYKQITDVQGVICEFGIQWGAALSTMMSLRGMLEPYNHARKIYGFDTFEGFVSVDTKDRGYSEIGQLSVSKGYDKALAEILSVHEQLSPLSHIKKFELIKGDASKTFPQWLKDNPHAIVAMAVFDMDLYKPTKDVLKAIIPRLTKGSLLVFDELNCQHFPGETEAVAEVLGLHKIALKSFPHQAYCSWAVWEG